MSTTKPAYEQLTKAACVSRLRHGLPLTIEQQRWMATQIWGPIGPHLKRCDYCNENGKRYYFSKGEGKIGKCDHCDGRGYVCAECNGTGGTIGNECICGDGIWYSGRDAESAKRIDELEAKVTRLEGEG